MLDQRGGHADRPDQVGVDRREQHRVIDLSRRLIWLHDAGVVDEHVQIGMLFDQLFRGAIDAGGIGDVELERRHARIGGDYCVEMPTAAPSDNYLVTEDGAANRRASDVRGPMWDR